MKWIMVPAVVLVFATANVANADLLGRLGVTFGNDVVVNDTAYSSYSTYGGPTEVYSDGVAQHSGKALQHGDFGCCQQKPHHAFGLWNGYCGGHGFKGYGGKCGSPKTNSCKPHFGWHGFKSECGGAPKGCGCGGQLQKGHVSLQKGHGHEQKGHVSVQKGHGHEQKSFGPHAAQKGCDCGARKHASFDKGCGCDNACGGGLFGFLHKGHGLKGCGGHGCESCGDHGKGFIDYGKGGVILDHGQSFDDVPMPIPSVDEQLEVEPANSAWREVAPRRYRAANWSY